MKRWVCLVGCRPSAAQGPFRQLCYATNPLGNITICSNHYLWPLGSHGPLLSPEYVLVSEWYGDVDAVDVVQWRQMVVKSWTWHLIVRRIKSACTAFSETILWLFPPTTLMTATMKRTWWKGRACIPWWKRTHGGRSICWCRCTSPA